MDTFTYTYVDGDGDPVSATLKITIADNAPVAGNVNVGLDDDALSGGNAGGVGFGTQMLSERRRITQVLIGSTWYSAGLA